ncbi:urokinase plasminogen activator surface receptor-like [Chamaea fasciata]|uniref:urokinase plasminogen activator surface receptor-like n=1 Tax=Chamaea fasciata TaxID=190680 RepID=UPI00336A6321
MGWGRGAALLWALLGAAPALLCPRCDVTSGCRPAPCPSPRAVCRRTTLTTLKDGREWRRELTGCDVTGAPEVVLTFRSHGELVTLREERWGGGAEEEEGAGHAPSPPPAQSGRPLLCPTCDSSDGSCGRRPLPALPCPRPQDLCLDVISRGPAGEGAERLRGCGRAGNCRDLLAFDSGRGRGGGAAVLRGLPVRTGGRAALGAELLGL